MTKREELAKYQKALDAILEGGQSVEDNGLKIERPSLSHIQKRIKELESDIALEEGGGYRVTVW